MPLANWLQNSRQSYPDKVALIFGSHTWTYTAFDEIADRMAASLSQMGVQPGDRVALHLPNCPELIFSYYACFKLGAIAVPLVPLLKAPELEYILNHCEATVCISHTSVFAEVQSIRAAVPSLQHCFLVGNTEQFPNTQPFSALIQPLESGVQFSYAIDDSRIAAILYTSGTTARPKGVTHTHASLQNAASYYVQWADLKQTDVLAGMLALTHIFGFTLQLLSAVRVGATLMSMPSREPERLLQAMQWHRATKLYGLPVMYNQLVHHPNAATYDLSALQACFAGGDAVAIALHERFKQVFGLELTEGCGMTEVIPYSMNPPFGEKRLGSIGNALIGMTLRLVDDHDNDVALGEVGEIWVKSDAAMIGYWNNPEATAAVMQAGWLRTGDLAYQDADGYYWFISRKKEIIVRGGSNISPIEVESVLYQHPAVWETAVIGVPDAYWGEVVWAYVSLQQDGASVPEASLQAFVAERLAAHKVPVTIHFLPELPKGLTGKIHRKTLKEWALQAIKESHTRNSLILL